MFLHNLKYSLKTLFRSKALIFWTFAFPILLGTLFNMAFSNIEKNDNYVVREVNVPNGYTVTYQKDGNLFIVTNTSSLVHTGQMYWLVGLFLSIGIIFIITSLLYDRNKNEQKG